MAPKSTLETAQMALLSHQFEEAKSLFSKLIEKNPNDAGLYSWRAQALIQLNLHGDATADIEKALSLEKDTDKRADMEEFLKQMQAEAAYMGDKPLEPYTTPLYKAASSGDFIQVKALVAKGADKEKGQNARNSNCSPLSVAAEKGHLEIVHYLLDQGADIESKVDTNLWDGPRYWTPLLQAAHKKHRTVVELLVSKGADLQFVDNVGWGAVRAALVDPGDKNWEAAEDLARWLINQGAPVTPHAQNVLAKIEGYRKK